jgi:7-cyano-7-deazaguanine synthase in queuosine biosynthesis
LTEFTKHIVTCGGYGKKYIESGTKRIDLEHRDAADNPNTRIKLQKFVHNIYSVKSRYKDLLIIAGYLFAADRKTRRGSDSATEYHSWSRYFHLHIGVRDLEFWNRDEIKVLLNDVLTFMTGDHRYEFSFYRAEDDFPTTIFDNDNFSMASEDKLNVMLFSGGIDSLAGAIEALETTEHKLCLVTHQSGQNRVKKTQREMFNALKEIYPDRLSHYKYECGLRTEASKDETQRTRSFLYTSTAFVVAKTYGQDKIFVYENGITSLNFAETQDLMNARSSRTTHPKTLALLEKLFSAIGESNFTIENDYLNRTKTDVISVLKKFDKLTLLDSSVSCSKTRDHTDSTTHCGKCSQCIDRRFAAYSAEIEEYDDTGIYDFDFLRDSIGDDQAKKALIDYIRLAQNFKNESATGFYLRLGPELVEIEPYIEGKTEEERIQKVYELCQRHSDHIEKAIARMRMVHDKPLKPMKPNSFFTSIVGTRAYQKSEEELKKEAERKRIDHSKTKSYDDGSNRELENSHAVIKKQKRKIRFLEQGISKERLEDIVNKKCRKKNGKINYSELGRQIGCTHHTAKDKCEYFGIN